jgi:hypothetical protein
MKHGNVPGNVPCAVRVLVRVVDDDPSTKISMFSPYFHLVSLSRFYDQRRGEICFALPTTSVVEKIVTNSNREMIKTQHVRITVH